MTQEERVPLTPEAVEVHKEYLERCKIDLLRADMMKAGIAKLCCAMRAEGQMSKCTPESDADEMLNLIASWGGALVVDRDLPNYYLDMLETIRKSVIEYHEELGNIKCGFFEPLL